MRPALGPANIDSCVRDLSEATAPPPRWARLAFAPRGIELGIEPERRVDRLAKQRHGGRATPQPSRALDLSCKSALRCGDQRSHCRFDRDRAPAIPCATGCSKYTTGALGLFMYRATSIDVDWSGSVLSFFIAVPRLLWSPKTQDELLYLASENSRNFFFLWPRKIRSRARTVGEIPPNLSRARAAPKIPAFMESENSRPGDSAFMCQALSRARSKRARPLGRAFCDHVDERSAGRNLCSSAGRFFQVGCDDMRLLGYEDSTPEIDVCEGVQ
jgi:hypothetical protein